MTTIRQAHIKQFVCISNKLAQNNNLSLRARGLMAYLLSLPDHWEIHINHLVKEMKEGRHIIRDILHELKKAGYIHHLKLGFKEGWKYFVFETPPTEQELKEFLRTIRFSNSSIFEQFDNRPLYNTNRTRNSLESKKNPPPPPPRTKKKEEEDFFSKRKEEVSRPKKVQEVINRWTKEGRPKKVIDETIKAYYEQPLGRVRCVEKWLESVYAQKFECNEADELLQMRIKFSEKIQNECSCNYYFDKNKGVLCYISGTLEKIYDINGLKKGSEEFWNKNNLGKQAFISLKEKQRGANSINSL